MQPFTKTVSSHLTAQKKEKKVLDYYKISDSRAPDDNKAIFGEREKKVVLNDDVPLNDTKYKKQKLPEEEENDEKSNIHEQLSKLIEDQFVSARISLDNNKNALDVERLFLELKETDLLKEFFAEKQLRLVIKKYIVNQEAKEAKEIEESLELSEELPVLVKEIVATTYDFINKGKMLWKVITTMKLKQSI